MAGLAQLPHDVLRTVLHLTLSPSTIVRATISCKSWQSCVPPALDGFWRSVYASAGLHVAALPRKVPPPTTPDSDEIDWYSACCYQSRVLHNILSDRHHIRILDLTFDKPTDNSTRHYHISTGPTKIAINLLEVLQEDIYNQPPTWLSCKVLSIEDEAVKRPLWKSYFSLNGDFLIQGSADEIGPRHYRGADLRDWKALPSGFAIGPLSGPHEFRTANNWSSWGSDGRVLFVSRENNRLRFAYFDLAEQKLLSKVEMSSDAIGNAAKLFLHEGKCFYTRSENRPKHDGGVSCSVNYFVIPTTMDVPPEKIQFVKDCGPRLQTQWDNLSFFGDRLLYSAASYFKSLIVKNFRTGEVEESLRGKFFDSTLTESFVYAIGHKRSLLIFQRGVSPGKLVLIRTIEFGAGLKSLHSLDDGRVVLSFDSSRVALCDFGKEVIKPVRAVVWRADGSRREVTVDPNRLLQDAAEALDLVNADMRSFFAPIPGVAPDACRLVLVTLTVAIPIQPSPLLDAFWRGTVSSNSDEADVSESTHNSALAALGGLFWTPPMVLLKRDNEAFFDFQWPADAEEGRILAQSLSSLFRKPRSR